jgi:hypothetical protein
VGGSPDPRSVVGGSPDPPTCRPQVSCRFWAGRTLLWAGMTSGSLAPSVSFALAAGNTSAAALFAVDNDEGARAIVPHRVVTTPRRVDQVMDRWGHAPELGRPGAGVMRAARSLARQTTWAVELDLLTDELDTTISLIAGGIAQARG